MTEKKKAHTNSHTKHKTSHIKHRIQQAAWMALGGVLLTFLCLNIVASQMVHPLYGAFVQEEIDAQVAFYKVARDLPEFDEVLQHSNGTYISLQDELDKENTTRREQIAELELLLEQQPNSRDVLYALYQLNYQMGEKETATMYLDRAQAIDPLLKE